MAFKKIMVVIIFNVNAMPIFAGLVWDILKLHDNVMIIWEIVVEFMIHDSSMSI